MGTYTEIVSIISPSIAAPGEQVIVEAQIKNIYPGGTILVTATGKIDSASVYFGNVSHYIAYGLTESFYQSFVMPSINVTVEVWSWYKGTDGNWYQDDYDSKVIVSSGEPPDGDGFPASDIADFNLLMAGGTYNLGDEVSFEAPYKHVGAAMGGTLVIELGTGVYPTFSTVYTFPSIHVDFSGSYEWTPGQLSGSIVLPQSLSYGQTYSVRATLRTNDGAQEIDTDWGVVTIVESPSEVPFEVIVVNIINYYNKTAGSGVILNPGDILAIDLDFTYKSGHDTSESLWASIGIGVGRDVESFKTIQLDASLTEKVWSGSTEISIPASGITNGTYWMKAEIGGKEETIQGAVIIQGMADTGFADLGNLILMMVMVMMMNMVMGIIESPGGFMESVGKVAEPLVKIYTARKSK